MKTLTKAQALKLSDLRACVVAASDNVFDVMPGSDIRFMTCYAAAPMPIRMAYGMAMDTLCSFERAMISEGRGYPDSFGHFQAYPRGR